MVGEPAGRKGDAVNKIIKNPHSGFEIRLKTDDPLKWDEMLRDMASAMLSWKHANDKVVDARDAFAFAMEQAILIAKRRQCSDEDWLRFVGYAGLLAAQAYGQSLLADNSE